MTPDREIVELIAASGGPAFFDTNVLVYIYDAGDISKRDRAIEVFDAVRTTCGVRLSTQVLQEFYVVVTRKLPVPMPEADAQAAVHDYAEFPVTPVDASLVLTAVAGSRRNNLSLWDALILEAARQSGCPTVISEDFQDGFVYEQAVRVLNPFGR